MRARTQEAHGLTVIHHHRQPHEFLTSHRGLVVLLAAVDTAVAWYLITTPTRSFAAEETWVAALGAVEALGLSPTNIPLGTALALVAAGTWSGILGVPWIARLSLVAALAPWGLISSSFAVAWMQTGIGFMTATLSGAVVILHLASVGHFAPGRRP